MKDKIIFTATKGRLSIEISDCSVDMVVVDGFYSQFLVNLPSTLFGSREFGQFWRHIEQINNVANLFTPLIETEHNEQSHIKYVSFIRNVLYAHTQVRDNWKNCEIVLRGELNE